MKAEPRHTFSIYLPASLYQKLLDKAGKGKISTFIKQMLEEKLAKEEKKKKEQLRQQLIKGYQARTRNKNLQKTLQTYGKTSWEDLSVELIKRERKNVQNHNERNEYDNSVVALPITTDDLENILPVEVFINNTPETGLDKPSKILCDSPFTWDKGIRFDKKLGVANKEIMNKAKKAWEIAFD